MTRVCPGQQFILELPPLRRVLESATGLQRQVAETIGPEPKLTYLERSLNGQEAKTFLSFSADLVERPYTLAPRRSRRMTHFRSVKVTHLENRISV